VKILLKKTTVAEISNQYLVTGIFEDTTVGKNGLQTIDKSLRKALSAALSNEDFTGKNGELFYGYSSQNDGPRNILVVGLGKREELTEEIVRRAFGSAGKAIRSKKSTDIALYLPKNLCRSVKEQDFTSAALQGLGLSLYRFTRRGKDVEKFQNVKEIVLVLKANQDEKVYKKVIADTEATINGVCFARDLNDMPGGELYPETYAEIAKDLSGGNLSVEIFDTKKVKKLGMGGIMSVGQGSAHTPYFIHLTYTPKKTTKDTKTFAFVGKGVTFDSGGLDIKPAAGMRDMKGDMAGSAAVMGVFHAIKNIKPDCIVHGFIGAAENMTGGLAYHPGDVVTTYKGLTIEVDNTDAEGRLTLADALAYAVEKVSPDAIIDIATLTGACWIALGHHATGMMGTDEKMMKLLEKVGQKSGERVWRLPLWDDYKDQIKSEIADMKNTGGRPAGATTAGLLLKEFVDDTPWVHLDIAGTSNESPLSYCPHKELGTGVGVRLILEMLNEWA
jgi:leucyl aminopeptidase